MSLIALISGSPGPSSRSGAMLDYLAQQFLQRGLTVANIAVRDFPAEPLLQAKYDSPVFDVAKAQIAAAEGVVVATPVYKAAYSGVLKTFLDILPQSAFRGKTVLPIATGGSAGHQLAIDFTLKPLLAALYATDVLRGIYAIDSHFSLDPAGRTVIDADILRRLDDSVSQLVANLKARETSRA